MTERSGRGRSTGGGKRWHFLKLPVAKTPNYWTQADKDTDIHPVQLTKW